MAGASGGVAFAAITRAANVRSSGEAAVSDVSAVRSSRPSLSGSGKSMNRCSTARRMTASG